MITTIIGWSCTAMLIFSYILKGETKLRIANSIASILFIIYGIMLEQPPMIVSNGICLAIHLYHLITDFLRKCTDY